jgi:uncharacterized protein
VLRYARCLEPSGARAPAATTPGTANLTDQPTETPAAVVVPAHELSAEALRRLVESFVLREGTEYGAHDVALADKVADVMRQLGRGAAEIVFDPASESIDIVATGGRGAHRG